MARYEMRDLGPVQWFLGIRVTRDREQCTVYLCQDSYIDKVANRYHLTNWKAPTTTPLPTEELVPYELKATPQEIHAYQGKVGSLQFTATVTRPDTAYAASKLVEFLTNPGPQQTAAVDQALTYLYATRFLAIAYAQPEPESTSAGQDIFDTTFQRVFDPYSDASFANCTRTRRSAQGYLFKLFGGPIDWQSNKQKTVSTSTTEAELFWPCRMPQRKPSGGTDYSKISTSILVMSLKSSAITSKRFAY